MNYTNLAEMKEILRQYGITAEDISLQPLGSGLINHTWLVSTGEKKMVLQQINQQVFRKPEAIAYNIRLLAGYLQQMQPGYLFPAPVTTLTGEEMLLQDGRYYRLFPFVEGSHTIDVVSTPGQAYEAARQFGKFTHLLHGFDATRLQITLPDFHNLPLRYEQFKTSLRKADPQRMRIAGEEIAFLKSQYPIVDEYLARMKSFPVRVIHHDTKISNVLFDEQDKGLCVIDLDTIMPGFFISDVGDMMRTCLCPVSEEEADATQINIRPDYYHAIVKGYGSEMNDVLTDEEKNSFLFAGKFMIYMQALRFLTDYLNNDIYYGSRYEGQNHVRARNQSVLLQRLTDFGQTQL